MAESDKTLKKEDNFSNENRKSSVPNIVPITSGSIHNDKSTVPNTAVSEPSTLKRKQTSFQITSVTVKKGSRLSTDGGEDSADDLDESHTEDASSDILDCSRTTDDQFSEDNCNTTHNDDTSTQAPSIPLESKKHLSIKKIAQDNAVFPSETSQVDKLDITPDSSQDVKPPTLPDQWQHRFRVVKIVSSVPFKRGRWLCMDFMDPPVPAVEAKPESIDVSIGSSILPGESIPDRVAHVYEIPPGDAYPGTLSMAVRPDERLQPMYGIFWPISNGQYPFMTGINSKSIASPLHAETKTHESNPSMNPAQGIQHQQNIPPSQTSVSPQVVQQQNLNIPNAISSQAGQHQQNISSTQSAISTTGFQHQQNISSTQSVSSQGIQHQQNVPNTQPVVSSQGIQHQQSLSVVQPPVSNLGIIQPVSSSQPPITSQGMQQTISNTQSTVSTQCNQLTSSTQSSISTQGVQQVFNNAQTVISNQGIPSSNIQSITPGIQQTVSGTQSVVSNQGVQPNTTGLQSSNSVLGIQPNLSVSQAPINQGGQLQNMGNIPAVSSQGIQKQNVNVIHTAVSSQPLQHQNVSGVPPIVTQGILQPSTVSGVQSVSNQGIQQQSMPNTQATLVEHPKLTNTGVQNIPNQIQDMSSQSIILGHSSSPPQSQSSVQVIQNVAGQQQAVTSESIPHVKPVSILQAQESQPSIQPHMQILGSSQSQAMSATPTMQVNVETVTQPIVSSSVQDDISQVALTQEPAVQSSVQLTSTVPASTMGNHALATATTPDVMLVSNSKPQEIVVPSQIIQNHVEAKELGTPPSTNVQVTQDVSQETQSVKGDVNGEETESVPSGTSTVAIDNKIEQAMDLVKSHLMFAVREEVDVLKEKITELMDRISQLEYENGFLRANASQQTLEQLNHSQLLQQQQQQNISSTVSLNSVSQISQQPLQSHQLNIQDQQPTS